MNNKALIANSVIWSLIAGKTDFVLIDKHDPSKGFVGQEFPPTNPDSEETKQLLINRESMIVMPDNRVMFTKAGYIPPTLDTQSEQYNNWLLAISIQDSIVGHIGKERYQELKKHIYRIWFNQIGRRADATELSMATDIHWDDQRKLKWRLGYTWFVFDIDHHVPRKEGRVIELRPNTNHLLVFDKDYVWVLDLILHSTGWDSLIQSKVNNLVTLNSGTIAANLSRNPTPEGLRLSLVGE